MRISDWSSDVCSSDLNDFDPVVGFGGFSLTLAVEHRLENRRAIAREHQDHSCLGLEFGRDDGRSGPDFLAFAFDRFNGRFGRSHSLLGTVLVFKDCRMLVIGGIEFVEPRHFRFGPWRSEEQTSELQSLMRISY